MPGEPSSNQEAALNKIGLMYILHFVTGSSQEAKLNADTLETLLGCTGWLESSVAPLL